MTYQRPHPICRTYPLMIHQLNIVFEAGNICRKEILTPAKTEGFDQIPYLMQEFLNNPPSQNIEINIDAYLHLVIGAGHPVSKLSKMPKEEAEHNYNVEMFVNTALYLSHAKRKMLVNDVVAKAHQNEDEMYKAMAQMHHLLPEVYIPIPALNSTRGTAVDINDDYPAITAFYERGKDLKVARSVELPAMSIAHAFNGYVYRKIGNLKEALPPEEWTHISQVESSDVSIFRRLPRETVESQQVIVELTANVPEYCEKPIHITLVNVAFETLLNHLPEQAAQYAKALGVVEVSRKIQIELQNSFNARHYAPD